MELDIKGILLISAGLLIVISLIFGNYGLSNDEFNSNFQVSRYSSNGDNIYLNETHFLYVDGNGFLEHIADKFVEKMEEKGVEVELVYSMEKDYERPLIIITSIDRDMFYTPIVSYSSGKMMFYYSSTGDNRYYESFKNDEGVSVVFNSTEGSRLVMDGNFDYTTQSQGFYTYNYFVDRIAERTSEQLIEKIK